MAAFSSCRNGIWFRRPNPLSRRSSKAKSIFYLSGHWIQQDRKSRGHNIQCLFAAVCQLEPALLSVEEIYEPRHKPCTVKQSQERAARHFERCFALCVCVRVWLSLVNGTDWSKLCLYFCHPFLRCDSCCLETKTNTVLQTLVTRILIIPLARPCAFVCVCACWKGQIWGVTGPVWLGGTPALVCERDQSFLHHSS